MTEQALAARAGAFADGLADAAADRIRRSVIRPLEAATGEAAGADRAAGDTLWALALDATSS